MGGADSSPQSTLTKPESIGPCDSTNDQNRTGSTSLTPKSLAQQITLTKPASMKPLDSKRDCVPTPFLFNKRQNTKQQILNEYDVDRRRRVPPTHPQWANHTSQIYNIGKLRSEFPNNNAHGWGTAVIIGHSSGTTYLLTCAHNLIYVKTDPETVVIDARRAWLQIQRNANSAYGSGTQEIAKFAVQDWVIHPRYRETASTLYDLAVVRVLNRHDNFDLSGIEPIRLGDGDRMKHSHAKVIGYPGEHVGSAKAGLYGMRGAVEIRSYPKKGDIVYYGDIDTTAGQSGGPIFADAQDGDEEDADEDEKYDMFDSFGELIGIHAEGSKIEGMNQGVFLNGKHLKWIEEITQFMTREDTAEYIASTRMVFDSFGVGDDGDGDKYSKWRKFFRPMSTRHFKTLKESEKLCSICFCEFEAKELFANQTTADAPPPPPPQPQATTDTQTTDTNNHNGHNNDSNNNGSMDDDGDSAMLQSAPSSQSTEDHKENAPSKTDTDTDELKQTEIRADMQQLIGDETIIHLSHCANDDHYFHTECIARWLNEKGKCCHCQKRYAVETGNQPLDGQLSAQYMNVACAGFHNCGAIRVTFQFNGGIQGPEHYHPGAPYTSECREAFFPDNMAGREALELTKMAWQRRLIFSVGKSLTTQRENVIVWASIHFKTRMSGGQQRHGYPDETYFDRFKEELKAKGLTVEDFDENAKHRIQHATGHQNNMYM